MNNVDKTTHTNPKFFPNTKNKKITKSVRQNLKRNADERIKKLKALAEADAKVNIPNVVKDFARIKNTVDKLPPVDNSKKIADLKERIRSGNYNINYEALADKMLANEF